MVGSVGRSPKTPLRRTDIILSTIIMEEYGSERDRKEGQIPNCLPIFLKFDMGFGRQLKLGVTCRHVKKVIVTLNIDLRYQLIC